ncbi:hypothetical protein [Corynebacterium matruchotii]|uniref:Uncharacterized protein n=2 Tax=Corynebacterium matruchotii TaxID=43768 RepID=E0DCJ8_9CORY|nr:hypothetical protein [Corynebacterium matruchotii]EFM50277.1 hypothetical protein HMPREF0299_6047 [Corynebacterium matruchotii ATCC 14266]KAB1925449.1 hypothetical protein F8196_05095 [Corynebacterium matruchotii]QIP45646.1 hypothetical protein HBA49_09115 [Corynebacterium matruchotii]
MGYGWYDQWYVGGKPKEDAMKPAAVITTLILVVGVLISPGAAVAQTARGTNPYQVRYKNGHCIFSLDETNPEARKYLADSDLINRSYVMEAVAREVPDFGPLVADNPRLENKLATDPTYQKRWGKVVAKLKSAGYTGNDIMWLDAITLKRGVRDLDEEVAHAITPREAMFAVKAQSRSARMYYAPSKLGADEVDGELAPQHYWRRDAPYPELSQKITGPANAGYQQLVERARTFAGYRYDALMECSGKGEPPAPNPSLRKDPIVQSYTIISQVSPVLLPAF